MDKSAVGSWRYQEALVWYSFKQTVNQSYSAPEASQPPSAVGEPARPSRWKQATLASILSLFFSGMGQLYNRQPRRALVLGIVGYLFTAVLLAHTRILLTFRTMIAVLVVEIVWKVLVVGDAAVSAGQSEKAESPAPLPWLLYPVLALALLVGALTPSAATVKEQSGFNAFKIPSRSMCPTICLGDRVVVDMHAYRAQPPQRGDIIVMKHASSEALFVKRVIGLPGDVVSPSPDGSVLVNGKPFRPPAPCATPVWEKSELVDYSEFHRTKVPEGNYFVVGDNLQDSYDSRIATFGAVTPDMVRGKPLYLYWSPTRTRIGCSIN